MRRTTIIDLDQRLNLPPLLALVAFRRSTNARHSHRPRYRTNHAVTLTCAAMP